LTPGAVARRSDATGRIADLGISSPGKIYKRFARRSPMAKKKPASKKAPKKGK
jgi:hypothetical protein